MRFASSALIGLCGLALLVACGHSTASESGIERVDSTSYRYALPRGEGELRLVATTDTTYEIQHLKPTQTDAGRGADLDVVDRWVLDYPTYRFDIGDLTGDGLPEVVVGTIKPTRYRPDADKRLFVYHLYDGHYIRPLWLGSRVGRPLIDFCVERDSVPSLVHTWERGADGDTIQALYRMKGFGLKFYKYLDASLAD